MRLYEYEAKAIFKRQGISVPEGFVTDGKGYDKPDFKKEFVVKSQVLIGARGKAGGIKFAKNDEELRNAVSLLIGKDIRGLKVKKLLVEEKLNIEKEFYAGVIFNRSSGKIVVIFSTKGGMEIEEVAKTDPSAILKKEVDISDGFSEKEAEDFVSGAGISDKLLKPVSQTVKKLYDTFVLYDAEIVEINPLVVTKQSEVLACDARMSIYDDAIPKQMKIIPEILNREDDTLTPLEKEARTHGLGYIEMDGSVGVIGNGAGLNLTTLDMLQYVGLKPANFLEVSGRTYDRAEAGLRIILKNPNVKVVFGNFFGCISRCDVIAIGLAEAVKKGVLPKDIPMVIAMRGNGGAEGSETLKNAGIEVFEDDETAVKRITEILKQ
ncbi:MAG: Succinyl-CoA ligase (ADP-forming) subunit beta [Elusimicrobia bacterium ADurb.Bin231]|nr:MAG: Succinyl-CoA ligase (ADP-forming) subunit beta [Elusimicrobia bacterium ADurb.Bin231]